MGTCEIGERRATGTDVAIRSGTVLACAERMLERSESRNAAAIRPPRRPYVYEFHLENAAGRQSRCALA